MKNLVKTLKNAALLGAVSSSMLAGTGCSLYFDDRNKPEWNFPVTANQSDVDVEVITYPEGISTWEGKAPGNAKIHRYNASLWGGYYFIRATNKDGVSISKTISPEFSWHLLGDFIFPPVFPIDFALGKGKVYEEESLYFEFPNKEDYYKKNILKDGYNFVKPKED